MASNAHMDIGDWIVVAFLWAFSITGAVFLFKHPDALNFAAWTGTLTIACGAFHWLRIRDQKQDDAEHN